MGLPLCGLGPCGLWCVIYLPKQGPRRRNPSATIHGDLILATTWPCRSLRDARDRAGRQNYRWTAVAFARLASGAHASALIQYDAIDGMELSAFPQRRWPDVRLTDPRITAPSSEMTIQDAAALARHKSEVELMQMDIMRQIGSR
jgi:hypothetical protein